MTYRADVDGLRALAILPVMLFHGGVTGFSGGFVGVDVFFVISGYVIALSLFDDLERGRFSIWRFYAKRIRRIFPALFVTVAVTGVLAYWLLLPSFFLDFSKSLLAAAVFLSNIYFWQASGYFAADAVFRPLLHTWSLSVEEQFYLFMPLATFVIYRFLGRRWLLILLPAILASLALSAYATTTAPTANFFILPTRAWELLIGAALALGRLPPVRSRWLAEVLGFIGLAMIAFAVFTFDETTAFPGLNALYPCLGTALLIYIGQRDGSAPDSRALATSLLSLRPLVFIGLISYSLYLIHWPIVSFQHYLSLDQPGATQVLTMLVASFILAVLSWRFVEQPFRRPRPAEVQNAGQNASIRAGLSQPRLLAGGLAVMVFFAVGGALGIAAKGFPHRMQDFAEQDIPGHQHWNRGRCFLNDNPDISRWNAAACTLTEGAGEATAPRVLLWGDSFAAHYVPGILANAARTPAKIIQYTAAGCPPILSYYSHARPRCSGFNANALKIIDEQDIDTVVLSARWTDMQSRGLDQLAHTLAEIAPLNLKVYVIGQSPQFAADIQVIAHAKGSRDPEASDSWRIFFDPAINAELKRHAGTATFIDPLKALCEGAFCPYRDNGTYLFEDAEHFSVEGSSRAVAAFFPLQQPAAPPLVADQAETLEDGIPIP